jgi:hypothetical protein
MSSLEEENDHAFAAGRIPGRFYLSKSFPYGQSSERGVNDPDASDRVGRPARFAYQVFDEEDRLLFAQEDGRETVLRETSRARQQLKAIFFEDDRRVQRLVLQRFTSSGKPFAGSVFSLSSAEVTRLKIFLNLIESLPTLPGQGTRLDPESLRELLQDTEIPEQVYRADRDEFFRLIEEDSDARDVIAIANRRKCVEIFERLLDNPEYFADRQRAHNKRRPEDLWQLFFEQNRWIFGFGLAGQVLLGSDRLETVIEGTTPWGHGKRADALMQTGGILSTLCLVEIKLPQAPLMGTSQYRPGVWRPSEDLSGGIAQAQTTIDKLVAKQGPLRRRDDDGNEIGEPAYIVRPRSYLLIGRLDQFLTNGRLNEPRYRCFEVFRRSISDPEVVTYDEMLERAKHLVRVAEEAGETSAT